MSEPTKPRPHVSEAWAVWLVERGEFCGNISRTQHGAVLSAMHHGVEGSAPKARLVRVRVTVEPIEEAR